jgi:hypothetical protein
MRGLISYSDKGNDMFCNAKQVRFFFTMASLEWYVTVKDFFLFPFSSAANINAIFSSVACLHRMRVSLKDALEVFQLKTEHRILQGAKERMGELH